MGFCYFGLVVGTLLPFYLELDWTSWIWRWVSGLNNLIRPRNWISHVYLRIYLRYYMYSMNFEHTILVLRDALGCEVRGKLDKTLLSFLDVAVPNLCKSG